MERSSSVPMTVCTRVLRRYLDQAALALEGRNGRPRDAIDALHSFIRKVETLSHRMVTDEHSASLVEFAEETIGLLR